jgi:glycosyltransferase involved in cell wall biosynthesis
MNKPLVSCLCATYAKYPNYGKTVGEAVESFLRQDYESKELIILNDCPQQELYTSAPVRLINLPERCPSMGDKFNLMAEIADGELLMSWDDDDLALPHRISQGVERIGDSHYWNPQRSWYRDANGLYYNHYHGYCHNAGIFRKDALKQAGGYESRTECYDGVMDGRLKKLGPLPPSLTDDPSDWSYIYQWCGQSNFHVSAYPDMDKAYQDYGTKSHVEGRFEVISAWQHDYVEMCRVKAAEWKSGHGK